MTTILAREVDPAEWHGPDRPSPEIMSWVARQLSWERWLRDRSERAGENSDAGDAGAG